LGPFTTARAAASLALGLKTVIIECRWLWAHLVPFTKGYRRGLGETHYRAGRQRLPQA
jgi:hypothetical protein